MWPTTIVDVATGQLLHVVEVRSAATACEWLAGLSQKWLNAIRYAMLDLSGPWRPAFNTMPPDATQVANPFHLIKLANQHGPLKAGDPTGEVRTARHTNEVLHQT